MYDTLGILIVYLLLGLPVAVVVARRGKSRAFSVNQYARALSGTYLSGLGTFAWLWASFGLAGEPDARSLSSERLLFGSFGMLLSLVLISCGLRLLSMPVRFAALFLAAAVVTVIGQAVSVWQITLAGCFVGPLLCLFGILVLWVRRELKLLK